MITVRAKRSVLDSFRRAAKEAFLAGGNETYAILIGHEEGAAIEITELYIPEDVAKFCSPEYVDVQDEWLADAIDVAREAGAQIVGDLHSHPGPDTLLAMSPGDKHAARQWRSDLSACGDKLARVHVFGICLVSKLRNRKLRTHIKFWGPTIPVKTVIEKK